MKKNRDPQIESYHVLAARLDQARAGDHGLGGLAARIKNPAPVPADVVRAALTLTPAGPRGKLSFFPAYRYEAAAMILFVPICAASFWLGSGLGLDLLLLP